MSRGDLDTGHHVADLDVRGARADHLDALGHRRPDTRQFESDVGATVGELTDPRDPVGGLGGLVEGDGRVGTESRRRVEATLHGVDDDHARAAFLRDGDPPQPEPARTLDHDGVARPDPAAVDARRHLGQRAVGADGGERVDVVGHLEHVLEAADVVVGAEGAGEVRKVLGRGDPVVVGVLAQMGAPGLALAAVLAEREVDHRHQVTGRQLGTGGVGGPGRGVDDAPDHLVAEHDRLQWVLVGEHVHVGATHSGRDGLDQQRPRLRARELVLPELDAPGLRHVRETSGGHEASFRSSPTMGPSPTLNIRLLRVNAGPMSPGPGRGLL